MTPDAAPGPPPLASWLAATLVVGTSAAVLVIELLAIRLLAPYVGVTLDTYTAIIGTVLAGIAIGAWIGGVAADRVDPRRLIPPLLVLGGALAIATIAIVRVLGDGLQSTSGVGVMFLSAIAFLPSATVLSAVPPAVVKLQLRSLAETGAKVGQLSAWGTAGAIVATFLTGFVLVAIAAVTTLIVTVGVALIIAGAALWATVGRATLRAQLPLIGVAAFIAVAAGLAMVAVASPCEYETAYYCASIEPDGDGAVLVLDDLRHSYVDLDDPRHLEFWYVDRIGDVIDALPAGPINIAHIGGGALTLPRYVSETRPGSEQSVFELDAQLIDIVERELPLASSDGIDIRTGDARVGVDDLDDSSVDVVVGDAFSSRAVPWHLTTVEFAEEIDRVLADDGVYVLNVIDRGDGRFLESMTRTLSETFEVTVVLGPSASEGRLGNSLLIASRAPITLDSGNLGGGGLADDVAALARRGQLLTDDYAPVDQLIAR
ncbi:MAG: fused MFS/spermidine synthase [Ilumatobacteraceae bacterium]|nr:fused MFS/spermidine synthase [Ilumatobacteraceae bacterium]